MTKFDKLLEQITAKPWVAEGEHIWKPSTGHGINETPAQILFDAFGEEGQWQANLKFVALAREFMPELVKALKDLLDWVRRVKQRNPGMEVANAVALLMDLKRAAKR